MSTRKHLIFNYITKYATTVTQLVTSIVLARLLTPEDIGIYTVAAVFIGLGYLLREFGINTYIIQEKELTRDRIRAALTLNLILGWGIAVILFSLKGVIGDFYQNPAIEEVVGLLCLNFILVPFGAVAFAHIRREMRFKHSMIIQITTAISAATTGIVSAYYGEAYLSLVWSALCGTTVSVLMTIVFRAPGLPMRPGFAEIPHVLAFCKYAGPSSIITYAGTTAPDWILGKTLGATAVGLYSRASGTIMMFSSAFMDAISSVTLPLFSKQHREGGVDSAQYLVFMENITAVAWPFFATLFIISEPAINVLFGDQWLESSPVLQILCINAFLMYATILVDDLLLATGNVKKSFYLNVIFQTFTIVAVLLTATYGLEEVAIGITVVGLIRFFFFQQACQQILDQGVVSFMPIVVKNLLLTLFCAIPSLLFMEMLGKEQVGTLMMFLMLVSTLLVTWIAGIWIFKIKIRHEVRDLYFGIIKKSNSNPS